ncbi:MAG: hypothetical protein EOO43_00610 [Flavobacterium sp.]|nr:MAG: hypothetical protein EOO43_00610 [Flavobacterium sp.]
MPGQSFSTVSVAELYELAMADGVEVNKANFITEIRNLCGDRSKIKSEQSKSTGYFINRNVGMLQGYVYRAMANESSVDETKASGAETSPDCDDDL